MSRERSDRSALLRLLSAAVLVLGIAAALAIYVRASTAAADGSTDDQTLETKQYQRQMEIYGGKANLLASDARGWIASLFHGQRLAYTTACLALLVSGILRLAAIPLPPLTEEERRRHQHFRDAGG
jgi:hypothetical protein